MNKKDIILCRCEDVSLQDVLNCLETNLTSWHGSVSREYMWIVSAKRNRKILKSTFKRSGNTYTKTIDFRCETELDCKAGKR